MKEKPTTDDIKRKYIMSRIKGKNTSIEIALRKALWHAGIRYRKNYSMLPGTPDIAITKHKIAVFCDGEFWHGKDWERKKDGIKSNREYWLNKIDRNIVRDNEVNHKICGNGWTVMRFWGNDIRDNLTGCVEDIQDAIFQSKMNSRNLDREICSLYPCWLICSESEGSEDELMLEQHNIGDLPCFGGSAPMPCQSL